MNLDSVDLVIVEGPCPICHGVIRTEWPTRFVAVDTDALVGQSFDKAAVWEVLVECNCGHGHGRKRETGCGMSTKVLITRV
ncbi:hypothetical protein [uncultured Microbacterium sp.]|uniref:hypothetical protein n=1 Tax=uncultured Microbacterium sp. TaxID=191216 RepID=UPI0026313FB2|nr:hypothetical protein [uncultured Microbacterium sp.]